MGAKAILLSAVMLGLAGGYAWSTIAPANHASRSAKLAKPTMIVAPEEKPSASDEEWAARAENNTGSPGPRGGSAPVYYRGCNEARAAGAAPIYAGQPGYRDGLDGDGDGIACEPYVGMNS